LVVFEEVKVKTWLPEKLDLELKKFRKLPQHLKRVQVNSSIEGCLTGVVIKMKRDYDRDIMKETLEVFKKHWDAGNYWMVHLVLCSFGIL
jgi:hypothetical protein